MVPGQPPSTNHIYVRVRGQWNKMAKAPGVESYQQDVALLARNARPSGFHASGQVRICFDWYLSRDADCDNLMKATLDGVALGLGMNDRLFLPCARSKTVGVKDPHTFIEVSDDTSHP